MDDDLVQDTAQPERMLRTGRIAGADTPVNPESALSPLQAAGDTKPDVSGTSAGSPASLMCKTSSASQVPPTAKKLFDLQTANMLPLFRFALTDVEASFTLAAIPIATNVWPAAPVISKNGLIFGPAVAPTTLHVIPLAYRRIRLFLARSAPVSSSFRVRSRGSAVAPPCDFYLSPCVRTPSILDLPRGRNVHVKKRELS